MTQPNTQPAANSSNTIWIYLSYITAGFCGWLFGLIGLAVVKDDEHVRFHCAQALVFSAIVCIVIMILWVIPIIGWFLNFLIGIAVFIYGIMIAMKAAKGEDPIIPICGDFAEKNVMGWFK